MATEVAGSSRALRVRNQTVIQASNLQNLKYGKWLG
jgi:hypothetical protein